MQVKNIAECSKGSILQYIRPALSYNLSLTSLFYLFLSGRFIQVLLFSNFKVCVFVCLYHTSLPHDIMDRSVICDCGIPDHTRSLIIGAYYIKLGNIVYKSLQHNFFLNQKWFI